LPWVLVVVAMYQDQFLGLYQWPGLDEEAFGRSTPIVCALAENSSRQVVVHPK
jgi:hypothetical protein